MNELITIIVPVYKVEKYIHKCVDSILRQSYNNLEIILVDDGSPDSCGSICDEYAKNDSRIKVLHKPNGGLSDARNEGLRIATGKYITLLDSDDYWKPTYIEKSYNYLTDNKADMVVFPLCSVAEDGRIIKEVDSGKIIDYTPEEALKMMFTRHLPWCAQGKLYKRELFDGIQYPVGKLMEDKATTYKIFEKCNKILFVECADYMYLIRQGSIMHSKFDQRKYQTLEIQEELNKYICDKHPALHDVVLGYSSRVYLGMLYQMIRADYPDRIAIERVVTGWRTNSTLLHKSDVVDARYKVLSRLTSMYYLLYGVKLYRSPSIKQISKIVSTILSSK